METVDVVFTTLFTMKRTEIKTYNGLPAMEVPDDLRAWRDVDGPTMTSHYGLHPEIIAWCDENLRGYDTAFVDRWMTIFVIVFDTDSDYIHFKLRWSDGFY